MLAIPGQLQLFSLASTPAELSALDAATTQSSAQTHKLILRVKNLNPKSTKSLEDNLSLESFDWCHEDLIRDEPGQWDPLFIHPLNPTQTGHQMREDERVEPNLDTTNSSHFSKPWLSKPGCWTFPRDAPGGEPSLRPKLMMLQGWQREGMGWEMGYGKNKKTSSERSLGVLFSHFTFSSFFPLEQECLSRYIWNHWNVFFQDN